MIYISVVIKHLQYEIESNRKLNLSHVTMFLLLVSNTVIVKLVVISLQ